MSTMEEESLNAIELKVLQGKDHVSEGQPRAVWSRKIEYLLSLLGYTVGLGSVWRFPYLCMRNGGGAFLIPFLIFMAICGFPLYFLELAIGQFSGKSPSVVWCLCPLLQGVGYSAILISFIVTWYYGIVIGWILIYLYYSFYPTQPWATCENDWNTKNCISSRSKELLNITYTQLRRNETTDHPIGNEILKFYPTAANEFWRFQVLNQSDGIDNWGSIQWHMALALFLSFAACFLCIIKGVKSVGKVAYVTATLPYILLIVILIRSLTLDGSIDGVTFFFKPDFSKLWHFQVWLEAALQVFYSLGPAWGGVITMASYNTFDNKCIRDAAFISIMDFFSAILGGMVVFSIIGFQAHEAGLTIPEISESGPGLLFQTYPEVLNRLPLPQVWSVLFFVMLFTIGLDSQFGMLETVISGVADVLPNTVGKRKTYLVFAVFALYMLSGLVFTFQAGVYIFQLIDWYASIFVIFLTSFLEVIIIGYIYGAERFNRDVEMMLGRTMPMFFRISFCVITPIAMAVALIATVVSYEHPVYKGYTYPAYIGVIGITIALIPVLPIPIAAAIQIKTSYGTFAQRIKKSLKPSKDWGPNKMAEKFDYTIYKYHGGILSKLKEDILGQRINQNGLLKK